MKLGWVQAQALQEHQVLAIILNSAFGSEDGSEPNSKAQAQAQIAEMFGGMGTIAKPNG